VTLFGQFLRGFISLEIPGNTRAKSSRQSLCSSISSRLLNLIACVAVLWCAPRPAKCGNELHSRPTPPGKLVNVGGYRVHLYCMGKGRPTVMIVGAAFSFDWGLVQPEVARFTHVCTFDPSGTTWSDSFETALRVLDPKAAPDSAPTCQDRVEEIRRVTTHATIRGPYILVGYSAGALWARFFAAQFPESVAGMVIVDHAFIARVREPSKPPSSGAASARGFTPPMLISWTPIVLGFEDDTNFSKLPLRDREFHAWALAQHPVRPGEAMVEDCLSRIKLATRGRTHPLGNMPLAVISTPNTTPGYAGLQSSLLELSLQSRHLIASHSSHMIPIDQPGLIVAAIRWTVGIVRAQKVDVNAHP
jgi:pimeloyl-ACP methyl ester carboxylesterase